MPHSSKVLIVDDDRTIADTLALIFSSGGYETQTAYTAEQAIEIVAEWLPDLAIIDVVLPQTNGIDLAILLTAQCPACRLMLSPASRSLSLSWPKLRQSDISSRFSLSRMRQISNKEQIAKSTSTATSRPWTI
jgi:CheY-like chemotaxis protein